MVLVECHNKLTCTDDTINFSQLQMPKRIVCSCGIDHCGWSAVQLHQTIQKI